jgi:outer membrane lipoprotein carrier protein
MLAGIACNAAAEIRSDAMQTDALGEKLVHNFVTKVITLQSKFEQSLIDANDTIIERTSGVLEIERPTRFRWTYTDPYEQWLVADGLNIWSYDVDLDQVTVKPQAEALANTPALLLGGSEDALQQFNFGGTVIEEFTTWVRLEPKNKSSGFNRVELGFVDEQLMRMVFFDNLEQKTVIVLHDVAVNKPIDAERFEFSVPDGVDVVGTPATVAAIVP